MSIVYVVTEPTHVINGVPVSSVNLTPAAEFGSIEILLPNNQALFNNVQTVRTLREKLKNFTDDDFILPVGDPVLMCLVAQVASGINGGRVTYLKWDKRIRRYFSIKIDALGRAL
jgi:hypothetical protein